MALNGSFEKSMGSNHYRLRVVWSVSQSVANNTSTPTADIYLLSDSGYSIYVNAASGHSLTINGTAYSFSSPKISSSGGANVKLATINGTAFTHNTDGTKSISLSLSYKMNATLQGTYYGTVSASSTVTLNTIARASTPTITAGNHPTWQYIGDSITINTNRASTAFTHTITAKFGSKSVTVGTGIGASKAWTVPLDFLNAMPNGTNATCTITCTTYNGSTNIGSKTVNIALWAKDDVKPTVIFTVEEANSAVTNAGFTDFIQSVSKLLIKSTGKGAYSSTIKSYQVTAAGLSYSGNSVTTNVLASSGTVSVKVTDSRGRTGEATKNITVTAYEKPKIVKFNVHRCLADGTPDDDGENCKIELKAVITNIQNNAHKFYIKYGVNGSTALTTKQLTSTAYTFDGSVIITGIDNNKTYNITAYAEDSFKPAVQETEPLSTGFTLLDLNSNGKAAAFGKVSETNEGLEMGMPLYIQKGLFPTVLDSSVDLNTLKTPGIYAGNNSNLLNAPVGGGLIFSMEICRVGAASKCIQKITYVYSNGIRQFERNYNNDADIWKDWVCTSDTRNQVLWSGTGWYMKEGQDITLSEPISKQANGIILTFAPYYTSSGETSSTAKTWDNIDIFVSKRSVTGIVKDFFLASNIFTFIGLKKLTITDTQIIGNSVNNIGGTNNGITWDNTKFVLTKVTGC